MGRAFEVRKLSMAKTAGQKSKLYAKYGKQVYVAAKNGSPDPESNTALAAVIERAKREQVPAHVIDKAIDKAKGAGGEDYSTARYEGFGPGSTSVIVDCLTDNNNRTITDVRNCFTKTGSRLGAPGSVAHQFEHLAVLSFKGGDADAVLEAMLAADVDVNDVESDDGFITVFAPAADYGKAKAALVEAYPGVKLEADEVSFVPMTRVDLSDDDVAAFQKLLTMLNDCDDVQDVYHNANLPSDPS